MDVKTAIETRRAYRSLGPVEITDELVSDLAHNAILAASCFNNQPIRFVFVYKHEVLEKVKEALSRGNVWAKAASMIIAVFAKEDMDCVPCYLKSCKPKDCLSQLEVDKVFDACGQLLATPQN